MHFGYVGRIYLVLAITLMTIMEAKSNAGFENHVQFELESVIECKSEGYFVIPDTDCKNYINCVKCGQTLHGFQFECPQDTLFSVKSSACINIKSNSYNEELNNCLRENESDGIRLLGADASLQQSVLNKKQKRDVENFDDINHPDVLETFAMLTNKRCLKANDIFGDPTDCTKYYICQEVNKLLREYTMYCGADELFDEFLHQCVNPTSINPKSRCADEAINFMELLARGVQTSAENLPEKGSEIGVASSNPLLSSSVAPYFEEDGDNDEDLGEEDYNSYSDERKSDSGTDETTKRSIDAWKTSTESTAISIIDSTTDLNDEVSEFHSERADKGGLDFQTNIEFIMESSTTIFPIDSNFSIINSTWNDLINKTLLEQNQGNTETNLDFISKLFPFISKNYQFSIAILILIVLLFTIFFFCCYFLKSMYQWILIKKNRTKQSRNGFATTKACKQNSDTRSSSSTKQVSVRRSHAPTISFLDLEDLNKESVELKSVSESQRRKLSLDADSRRSNNKLTTFEIQAEKNIEIQPDNRIEHHETSEVNDDQPMYDTVSNGRINKRKRVEIYIPNLNLPNVREPAHVRSIVEEMEDEYFNIMESKELKVDEWRDSLKQDDQTFTTMQHDSDTIMNTDESTVIYDVVIPRQTNSIGFNAKIAHVSPYSESRTSSVNGEVINRENRLSTFKRASKTCENQEELHTDDSCVCKMNLGNDTKLEEVVELIPLPDEVRAEYYF